MFCIAIVSFAAGIAFLMMGAWPVFGFFGLDVVLIWWAIKRNYKDAHLHESIRITDEEIVVIKIRENHPDQTISLLRPWARVRLEEDHERELIGRLFISSKGAITEIGSFLAPYDRKSLAQELSKVLALRQV